MIRYFEISGFNTYKQAVSYFLLSIIYSFPFNHDINLINIIIWLESSYKRLKKKANNPFRTENTGGPDKETQGPYLLF